MYNLLSLYKCVMGTCLLCLLYKFKLKLLSLDLVILKTLHSDLSAAMDSSWSPTWRCLREDTVPITARRLLKCEPIFY